MRKSHVNLKRQRELLDRGNTSQSNYDTAVAMRDSHIAEVKRIEALIAEKSILGPFSGKLGIRQADVGQYVLPGTNLVSLQQLEQIAVADDVNLRVGAFPKSAFSGKMTAIDSRVDQATRNIHVDHGVSRDRDSLLVEIMCAALE